MNTQRQDFTNRPADRLEPTLQADTSIMARVYVLLSLTLMVSATSSLYSMQSTFVAQHYWMTFILSFVLLFATQFAGRYHSILAVPLVFLFAATMGAVMGQSIGLYLRMPDGATLVTEALVATTIMFMGLSAYAFVTRHDYSHIGGLLMTGLIMGILVSLLNVFLLHIPALQSALAGVFVLVFSGLIVYDTQRLRQQRDSAVEIVVELYLDIINLFMAILQILGSDRDV